MEGGEYLDTKGVAREVYRFTAPNLQRPPWVSERAAWVPQVASYSTWLGCSCFQCSCGGCARLLVLC